nr:MAG TPA: hypothetical protein [Caudoviricetes sp.]
MRLHYMKRIMAIPSSLRMDIAIKYIAELGRL